MKGKRPVGVAAVAQTPGAITGNLSEGFQIGDNSWYWAEAIDALLRDKFSRPINNVTFEVIGSAALFQLHKNYEDATAGTDKDAKKSALDTFLREQYDKIDETHAVAIPFNIDGYHWVVGILRRKPDGAIEFIYEDPMGHALDHSACGQYLNQYFQALPHQAEITNVAYNLQMDEEHKVNCGPYIIEAASALAEFVAPNPGTIVIDANSVLTDKGIGLATNAAADIRLRHATKLAELARTTPAMQGSSIILNYTPREFATLQRFLRDGDIGSCYDHMHRIKNWLEAATIDASTISHRKAGKEIVVEHISDNGERSFDVHSGPRVIKVLRLDASGKTIQNRRGEEVCDILAFNETGHLTGIFLDQNNGGKSQLNMDWVKQEQDKTMTADIEYIDGNAQKAAHNVTNGTSRSAQGQEQASWKERITQEKSQQAAQRDIAP